MQSLSTDFDEQGDYLIYGGLDEKWTDVDVDGEMDDEPEDHEDEVMISFQDTTGSEQLDIILYGILDEDDFYNPSISLIHSAILPTSKGHYYFSETGGR